MLRETSEQRWQRKLEERKNRRHHQANGGRGPPSAASLERNRHRDSGKEQSEKRQQAEQDAHYREKLSQDRPISADLFGELLRRGAIQFLPGQCRAKAFSAMRATAADESCAEEGNDPE